MHFFLFLQDDNHLSAILLAANKRNVFQCFSHQQTDPANVRSLHNQLYNMVEWDLLWQPLILQLYYSRE